MTPDQAVDSLKEWIEGLDGMYESMASKLGSRVKCGTCDIEMDVDSAQCLRLGWPKCCGHTMMLLNTSQGKRGG